MKLIDPSQRINVLWDNDDGTRYTEEMTIRRLLAVMSDDEVEAIELVRCGECMHNGSFDTDCPIEWYGKEYCNFGERRADTEEVTDGSEWYDYRDKAEADFETRMKGTDDE